MYGREGEGVKRGGTEELCLLRLMVSTVWCLSPPVQSGQRPPHKRPSHLTVRESSSLQMCVSLCVDSMNILLRA